MIIFAIYYLLTRPICYWGLRRLDPSYYKPTWTDYIKYILVVLIPVFPDLVVCMELYTECIEPRIESLSKRINVAIWGDERNHLFDGLSDLIPEDMKRNHIWSHRLPYD